MCQPILKLSVAWIPCQFTFFSPSVRLVLYHVTISCKESLSLLAEALSFVIPDEKIESLCRLETLCLKCRRPQLWTNKTRLYLV